MPLLLVALAAFLVGWFRARARGGGVADRVRYGLVHAIAAALVVIVVAVFGDFTGVLWW